MEILPMLVRLEHALNCPDLARQMLLAPRAAYAGASFPIGSNDIHLVVAYNGSGRSQTALDVTLWIAHQTRLATRRAVTVHVVYVADPDRVSALDDLANHKGLSVDTADLAAWRLPEVTDRWQPVETLIFGSAMAGSTTTAIATDAAPASGSIEQSTDWQLHQFEQADRILWQARNLADEWRGSLETHLRFGRLSDELTAVVSRLSATALVLGCASSTDPLVQSLAQDLPCPILGIPSQLTAI